MKKGLTQDAYMNLAQAVASQVAIRNASQGKTEVVEIKG
jgi:ATP-binding protein involved in chromosome partitioning